MKEDTEQLICNARQVLDDAKLVSSDELAAPHAVMLADAASYLHDKQVDYPNLRERLRAYLRLAANHAEAGGNPGGATSIWQRLAATFEPSTKDHREALLSAIGSLNRTGGYAQALTLLEQVQALAKAASDTEMLETVQVWLAPALCESGQPEAALALLQDVIKRSEAGGRDKTVGNACVNASVVARRLGRAQLAQEFCQRAIDIHTRLGNTAATLRARQTLAGLLADEARFEEAMKELHLVADGALELGSRRLYGIALGNIATTLLNTGDVQGGREMLERANDVFIELGDTNAIANTWVNIGASLMEEGLPERALNAYAQAETEFDRLGDIALRSMARLSLALSLIRLNRIDEAKRWLEREASCSDGDTVTLRCFWHATSGELQFAQGNLSAAREHFDTVLKVASEHGLKDELAHAATARAQLEYKAGDLKRALEMADLACDAMQSAGAVPPLLVLDALVVATRAGLGMHEPKLANARLTRAIELSKVLPLLTPPNGPRAEALMADLRELETLAHA